MGEQIKPLLKTRTLQFSKDAHPKAIAEEEAYLDSRIPCSGRVLGILDRLVLIYPPDGIFIEWFLKFIILIFDSLWWGFVVINPKSLNPKPQNFENPAQEV